MALPRTALIAALYALALPFAAVASAYGPAHLWGQADAGMDLSEVQAAVPSGRLLTDPEGDRHAIPGTQVDPQWTAPSRLEGRPSAAYFYFLDQRLVQVTEETSEGAPITRAYAARVKAATSRRFTRPPACYEDIATWVCLWMSDRVTVVLRARLPFKTNPTRLWVITYDTGYYRKDYPDSARNFDAHSGHTQHP